MTPQSKYGKCGICKNEMTLKDFLFKSGSVGQSSTVAGICSSCRGFPSDPLTSTSDSFATDFICGADPPTLASRSEMGIILNWRTFTDSRLGFSDNYPRSKYFRYELKTDHGFIGYCGKARVYKVIFWENAEEANKPRWWEFWKKS